MLIRHSQPTDVERSGNCWLGRLFAFIFGTWNGFTLLLSAIGIFTACFLLWLSFTAILAPNGPVELIEKNCRLSAILFSTWPEIFRKLSSGVVRELQLHPSWGTCKNYTPAEVSGGVRETLPSKYLLAPSRLHSVRLACLPIQVPGFSRRLSSLTTSRSLIGSETSWSTSVAPRCKFSRTRQPATLSKSIGLAARSLRQSTGLSTPPSLRCLFLTTRNTRSQLNLRSAAPSLAYARSRSAYQLFS